MRLKDALAGQKGPNRFGHAPTLDTRYGASMGFTPDYKAYVSNAPFVRRNLFALLLEAPAGFQNLPNPEYWVGALKALIEEQSLVIEGLTGTLTASFEDTPFGGAGEMMQAVSDMKRERSQPSHTLNEKYGRSWNKFLEGWMTGLLMDPDSKVPTVMANSVAANRPTDLLPDVVGATVLYIEPDPTHTHPLKAYLTTNMMPETGGEVQSRRDLTQAGEKLDIPVRFSGVTQQGEGVLRFAEQMMRRINMTGVNPNLRPAFMDRISADVSALSDTGYVEAINRQANTAISP